MMEEQRWDGIQCMNMRRIALVANIFHEEDDEECVVEGMRKDSFIYQELNAIYPDGTRPLGHRTACFRIDDRMKMIRRYYEDKGCPFSIADYGGNSL